MFHTDNAARYKLEKQFRSIIHEIAYKTKSMQELKSMKLEYDAFVSQDGLCKDKRKDMIEYLTR